MKLLDYEYCGIWLVDCDTLEMQPVKPYDFPDSNQMGRTSEQLATSNYLEICKKYFSAFAEPEELGSVLRQLDPETVWRKISGKERCYYGTYTRSLQNLVSFFQLVFYRLNSPKEQRLFAVGLRSIDNIQQIGPLAEQELVRGRRQARKAYEAKISFLTNLSHSLCKPLNFLQSYCRLLEKKQRNLENIEDYLQQMGQTGDSLLQIVSNVLELTWLKHGPIRLSEAAWSIEQFWQTVNVSLRNRLQTKKYILSCEKNIKFPFIYCDSAKLRRLFVLLLDNVYKFATQNSEISVAVTQALCGRKGWVFVQTRIEGSDEDVAPELLAQAAENFTCEKNTPNRRLNEGGLDLAIAQHLTDYLGGRLEIKRITGKRTQVIVTLEHRLADEVDMTEWHRQRFATEIFHGRRILLAEDEPLQAEVVIGILHEVGIRVDLAQNGCECVKKMQIHPSDYYDVVLMDIQIPEMNGYETTLAIRAMEDTMKAIKPIVALTANISDKDIHEAQRVGMTGFLCKPTSASELLNEIVALLA